MSGALRECKFCTRGFHDAKSWIHHYNSQHSTIHRPSISGYFTCKRCFKFIILEEETSHRCRRIFPNSRSTAILPPEDASSTSANPSSMSVSLEDYLIPSGVRRVSAPTASSTSRVTSIDAAPSARRSGSSSRRPNKDPRGDRQETAEVIHDPPCQQPGDSEGPRPSKPAAADDPATQGLSRRRLRSADATAATVESGHSATAVKRQPSRAEPTRKPSLLMGGDILPRLIGGFQYRLNGGSLAPLIGGFLHLSDGGFPVPLVEGFPVLLFQGFLLYSHDRISPMQNHPIYLSLRWTILNLFPHCTTKTNVVHIHSVTRDSNQLRMPLST